MLRAGGRIVRLCGLVIGIVAACLGLNGGGLQAAEPSPRRAEPGFNLPIVPGPTPRSHLSSGPVFQLRAVSFEGNTVFSDDELQAVAAPFIGRRVAAEDLEALRQALTQRYVDSGFVNSGALLPDQTVAQGRVIYRLVEGRLTAIEVTGNVRLQEIYLTQRLALSTGPPLKVDRLRQRFRILLDDPFIERLDAKLDPGTRIGESVLQAQVKETPPYVLKLTADNARSPGVGEVQGGAEFVIRNWTGYGEIITASRVHSEGLRESAFSLSLPLNPYDTRVSLRHLQNRSEVIERPFRFIDVESRTQEWEFGLRHPAYRTAGRELGLGLKISRRESDTFLLGSRFSFSPGADDGNSTVSVLRLQGDWLDRRPDQLVSALVTLNAGVDVFDATINDGAVADGEFTSFLGQIQWVRRIAELGQAIARLDTQLTNDRLLTLEKFALGGSDSVRGYRENVLVRDNGLVASAEMRIPIHQVPVPVLSQRPDDGQLAVALFADYGRSWDNGAEAANEQDSIVSGWVFAGRFPV